MKNKNEYMKMALRIAFDNTGMTSPNPAVGAVIVKNGEILSTGGTGPYGGNHAEVNAIENAKVDLTGSEMHVSLEPCCHFGKTPPCTDAIIKSGIQKVFIPMVDPNPEVAGKGIKKLQEAGVEVVFNNEMKSMAFDLLKPFTKFILKKKPFIINKCAMSLDGKIATKAGDSKWISSKLSRYISHKLRAKVDAIIIGKNTFQCDNPLLNVRFEDFKDVKKIIFDDTEFQFLGKENFFLKSLIENDIEKYKDPLRIILGIPKNFIGKGGPCYNDNYLIFTDEVELDNLVKEEPGSAKKIDKLNFHIIKKRNIKNRVEIILNELFRMGIMLVLLEGGGMTNGSFLEANEIDQLLYFISPKIFGNGIPAINFAGISHVNESRELKDVFVTKLGADILYSAFK